MTASTQEMIRPKNLIISLYLHTPKLDTSYSWRIVFDISNKEVLMRLFLKKLTASLILSTCLLSTTQPAVAQSVYPGESYYGGWWMSGRIAGEMVLGDGDGAGLSLGSTERYCVRRGHGYSKMRDFITSNYPEPVGWYVDEVCDDGYVRICVYSYWGDQACSTFRDKGWVYLD